MTLVPGTRLGSYEILGSIGAGGMGEVYRARDTRLAREAAIKVLPADLAGDGERRARFEQEARAASALNHPNILTVYDIGDADGSLYIAMEYVEGRTLRELLASGPVPVRKLLGIAAQVADGLAKAHAAGIVHRDLKPENVMVNKDGFAKILDFGLAKLAIPSDDGGSQLATMAGPGTRPGVVLGTVGYMSPEQASGQPLDFRSDQFALGAILYEMATGNRAFQKKTAVETLSAIIREEPEPISAAAPAAPAPLRWIVERCLAKEPEERYASTRDLARDLKQAGDHLSEASGEAPAVGKPKARRPGWWATAIAALLAVGLADLAVRWRASSRPAAGAAPSLRRVTFGPGLEDEPSFSPDGKFLAYTTDERGNLDVVVLPLAGGEPIRIAATDADEAQPAWSPDGSKIVFVSARDHGGRLGIALNISALEPYLNAKLGDIFLVPALGGEPVKLVEDGYYPAWSPDGKRIAYMSRTAGRVDLWTIPSDGGTPERLTTDGGFHFQPAWSPDGRWVACGSGTIGIGGPFNLHVVPSSGGVSRALTKDFGYVTRPAWSADGKTIFFSGERNGILNAWRVDFSPDGRAAEPVRVTLGQGQDANLSVSRDGRKLAIAAVRNEPNIWELSVSTGALRPVTSGAGGGDFPRLSPDGKTLLAQSTRSGDLAVWTVDLSGKFLAQLTPGQPQSPEGRWSPDGRQIAYVRGGQLWIQAIGSMSARDTGVRASTKAWSPDGKSIAVGIYDAEVPGEISVYSVAEGGVEPITALKMYTDYPTWSPDGRRIAFQAQRGAMREIWIVPAKGGAPTQLTKDSEDSHPDWSPRNPDEILFLRDHKRLAVLSVSSGKVRFLPGYSEGSYILDYPSWSPDGTRVYFSVMRKSGDLYVLEGF
ncbi:MAG: protein kinase domain-containing protein [Thermoanaerobaculia bacterium]